MGNEDQPRGPDGRWGSGLAAFAEKHAPDLERASKLGAHEVTGKEFRAAFEAAFKDNPYTNHVTHYSEEQLKGMRCFLSADGKAGQACHDHGDGRIEGTALFSNSPVKGAGLSMLAHAVNVAGVNYVECYGPVLNELYSRLGFREQTRDAFSKEYAAKGWDEKRFDSPDYITMKLEP